MLHFLPEQNTKQVRLEYIMRVCIYAFFFIFLASLLLISLFLPSVIFSVFNNQTAQSQLVSILAVNNAEGIDPTTVIAGANGMTKVFSGEDASSTELSDIVGKIVSLKNTNVQIASIVMTENPGTKTFVVSGTAMTRDDLTAFDNALVNSGIFASVNLPVSDLIDDTNDTFAITLAYNYMTFK
jgi:hypothetical protein